MERTVRLVLFDLSNVMGEEEIASELLISEAAIASELELLFAPPSSWAGDILEQMRAHHKAEIERRNAIAEFQDPMRVQQRREEKRRQRQQKHQERLALKKERDRLWRERQRIEGIRDAEGYVPGT
jgi:hypothetical protein